MNEHSKIREKYTNEFLRLRNSVVAFEIFGEHGNEADINLEHLGLAGPKLSDIVYAYVSIAPPSSAISDTHQMRIFDDRVNCARRDLGEARRLAVNLQNELATTIIDKSLMAIEVYSQLGHMS